MLLGSADEQKPAAEGTVEAWARSPSNPVGGWYGLKKGLHGRFANYVPPVMEVLGLAEVEHNAKANRTIGRILRRWSQRGRTSFHRQPEAQSRSACPW